MKVNLEKEGVNLVKLGVEVEADKAQKAYDKAWRQLSHRVRIPGFRPGKAPKNMIEKAVGVDFIKREALEQLVPTILHEVISGEKLDVITEPRIDSYTFELGQPLLLSASFEVRPEVKLGEYKALTVQVPEAKLDEEAMDRALKSIAEAKASLQTVSEKRPIKMGDTVLMDFECLVDGKLVEGGKAEGLLLEMKEGNFLPGFCEQLVGKEPGAEEQVNATFPDDYRNESLAGKDANFKVQLREIRERFTPEINDELAKSVGQESLGSLKEALKQRLDEEVKQENETRMQRGVVDEVVKHAQVEIPDSMIDRECNLLLAHLRRYVEQVGQTWDTFVQSAEYESVYNEKREEAKTRVLTSLVLGAVVRAENMTITEEESAPYLSELVARYNLPIEQIAHEKNDDLRRAFDELRRQAMEEALTRKVVDFLTGQSKVEYVAEERKKEEQPA
ncbi:MAG TPA: trigger factor [Candidatus Obscuribacterales bacterium]